VLSFVLRFYFSQACPRMTALMLREKHKLSCILTSMLKPFNDIYRTLSLVS